MFNPAIVSALQQQAAAYTAAPAAGPSSPVAVAEQPTSVLPTSVALPCWLHLGALRERVAAL